MVGSNEYLHAAFAWGTGGRRRAEAVRRDRVDILSHIAWDLYVYKSMNTSTPIRQHNYKPTCHAQTAKRARHETAYNNDVSAQDLEKLCKAQEAAKGSTKDKNEG